MFNALFEILHDLIPNKDLPNSVWISRYLILVLSCLLTLYLVVLGLQNTQLGSQYGLNQLERQSKLTHVTFTLLVRNTRDYLRNFINDYPSAKTIFVVTKYNPNNGFFTIDPIKSDRKIIWEFAAPRNLDLSITNLELYFKGANSELSDFETPQCVVKEISESTIDTLAKTVRMTAVDRKLVCPIFSSEDDQVVIAHTVVFFNKAEAIENLKTDEELMSEIWSINRKISELYTYFNTEFVLPK